MHPGASGSVRKRCGTIWRGIAGATDNGEQFYDGGFLLKFSPNNSIHYRTMVDILYPGDMADAVHKLPVSRELFCAGLISKCKVQTRNKDRPARSALSGQFME